MSGASDTLDVNPDAHIIFYTNTVDDGVSHGFVSLNQKVNDDFGIGGPPPACDTPTSLSSPPPLSHSSLISEVPARTPGVLQAVLGFHPATATGSAGTPSTSAATAGARDSSSWRGGAWTRTGATASADLKKEGDDITEGGLGIGQGRNTEGNGDSAEGTVASVGVGSGRGSGGRTVTTVAHDRMERQRLACAPAAALADMQPVATFSVTRNNNTTTASEFARPRGASGHGHARVAGLHSSNSNTTAPANPVISFFGPGNPQWSASNEHVDSY
ncbi:hypothetical protein DFH11DRAFT_1830923 [Phellopilus nigrolimitatus]|nr:hypothetical protein DFH11DRAFT_1830923 [Phellopilus nigrolimitatus]